MSSNSNTLDSKFLPEKPLDPKRTVISEQITGLLDGQPKDALAEEAVHSGWDEQLEKVGAELYRIASMLLGEGEEAIGLIENVIASIDLPASGSLAEARHRARLLLAADAISVVRLHDSADQTHSLAAPVDDSGPASCIEDDDLEAAGVTPDELEQMISGPEGHRLRDWLEGLSVSLRVVFVLRAVAGLSSAEISGLLAEHGGPSALDWNPDAVRGTFRQALCSLASQLIHATAVR